MPNLPGSSPATDAAMFARVLDDPALQAARWPLTRTPAPTLALALIKRPRPIPCSLCLPRVTMAPACHAGPWKVYPKPKQWKVYPKPKPNSR